MYISEDTLGAVAIVLILVLGGFTLSQFMSWLMGQNQQGQQQGQSQQPQQEPATNGQASTQEVAAAAR